MEDKRTWDCVKKPFQAIVPQDSAPKDNFLFGFGFIPSSSPPPLAMLWPIKHSVSPILVQIQLCLGWEGRGRQFQQYHRKGPNTFDLHCTLPCKCSGLLTPSIIHIYHIMAYYSPPHIHYMHLIWFLPHVHCNSSISCKFFCIKRLNNSFFIGGSFDRKRANCESKKRKPSERSFQKSFKQQSMISQNRCKKITRPTNS